MHSPLKRLKVSRRKALSAKLKERYTASHEMEPLPPEPPKRKLLDQVRDTVRLKHYSYRTEQSYVAWIRRYILFHNKRHPKDMGASEAANHCEGYQGQPGRCRSYWAIRM